LITFFQEMDETIQEMVRFFLENLRGFFMDFLYAQTQPQEIQELGIKPQEMCVGRVIAGGESPQFGHDPV